MKEKKSLLTNGFVVALGALISCALWGSATPFIKTGYELMLPEKDVPSTILFAGCRFALAGVLTVLFGIVLNRRWICPKKENLGKVSLVGLFQTVIQYIFFYIGLANTSGVKGTVLSSSNAFFCLLIASLVFRQEKLTLKKIVACIFGFTGIIMVNLNGLDFTMNFMGDGFVLIAAFSGAVSSILIKRYSEYEDTVAISGYQFLMGGVVLIIAGLLSGGKISVTTVSAAAVLTYLSFLSAVAYTLWGLLLKHNDVSKVTIYHFAVPIFGVWLSELMLKEQKNVSPLNLVITLVLVCTGILMINLRENKN